MAGGLAFRHDHSIGIRSQSVEDVVATGSGRRGCFHSVVCRVKDAIRTRGHEGQGDTVHSDFARILQAVAISVDPHAITERRSVRAAPYICGRVVIVTKISREIFYRLGTTDRHESWAESGCHARRQTRFINAHGILAGDQIAEDIPAIAVC